MTPKPLALHGVRRLCLLDNPTYRTSLHPPALPADLGYTVRLVLRGDGRVTTFFPLSGPGVVPDIADLIK